MEKLKIKLKVLNLCDEDDGNAIDRIRHKKEENQMETWSFLHCELIHSLDVKIKDGTVLGTSGFSTACRSLHTRAHNIDRRGEDET